MEELQKEPKEQKDRKKSIVPLLLLISLMALFIILTLSIYNYRMVERLPSADNVTATNITPELNTSVNTVEVICNDTEENTTSEIEAVNETTI